MKRVVLALVLVSLGWLASPSAVPVYDGVGSPDEPYRFVGRSPAPGTATVTVRVGAGLELKSNESGPQVLLDLGEGALVTPTRTVTLTATPLVPDGTPPRGTFDGNAYRVVAAAGARLDAERAQGFLFLRAAVMTRPDPVIVHRDRPTDAWRELRTSRVGTDILSTPFRAFGDYAVVRPPGAKPTASISPSTSRWLKLGGVVLALLVLGALVIRSRRQAEELAEEPADQVGPDVRDGGSGGSAALLPQASEDEPDREV